MRLLVDEVKRCEGKQLALRTAPGEPSMRIPAVVSRPRFATGSQSIAQSASSRREQALRARGGVQPRSTWWVKACQAGDPPDTWATSATASRPADFQ